MGNEAAVKNELLGLIKSLDFQFLKGMPSILYSKAGKGAYNSAIVLQKASVKVAETKE